MTTTPDVIVELIKAPPGLRKFPGRKPEQPYRWLVSDGGNHEPLERASERYRREDSALSAIEQVHGSDATVVLRRAGHPDRVLRHACRQADIITPDHKDTMWWSVSGREIYRWNHTTDAWESLDPYRITNGWRTNGLDSVDGGFIELTEGSGVIAW